MLYIFSGLPGTGKSTLAAALAAHTNACYLRIDTIEQAMREAGIEVDGPAGYMVAYAVARENLRLGRSVVADSVNPLAITRAAWRNVAVSEGTKFVEIEVICSDLGEHRARIESRQGDIEGLQLPDWAAVTRRHYEAWNTIPLVIDTAGQYEDDSIKALIAALNL